jgi:hypothetical protein
MTRLRNLLFLLIVGLIASSCQDKENPGPKTPQVKLEILIKNAWRLKDVTDASGKSIPQNQLSFETMAIYLFDIQFFDNNVTKAIDRVSKQVVNGGTWYLIEDEQKLDIEVSQFKGRFILKELTNAKMVLTNNVPVNGVSKEANLVFEAVIQ